MRKKEVLEAAKVFDPRSTLPKKPGELIDLYYTTREARLRLEKDVESQKTKEKALQDLIVEKLKSESLTAAKGKVAGFSYEDTFAPKLEDFDSLMGWIVKKKDRWSLLHKRIAVTALVERWDAGEKIPGVERIPVVKVHLNKL